MIEHDCVNCEYFEECISSEKELDCKGFVQYIEKEEVNAKNKRKVAD